MSLHLGPRTCVLGIVLLLVGAECALRAFGDFAQSPVSDTSARLGYRLVPGSYRGPHGASIDVNASGFRERELATSVDDPRTLRIAVLGDSVSFGQDVASEETWGRQLEQLASARVARSAQHQRALVYNFSVPGYTLEQMARLCEDELRAWKPAVVIISLGTYAIRPMRERTDPVRFPLRTWIQRSALYDLADRLRRRGDRERDPAALLAAERALRDDPHAAENEVLWLQAATRLEGLRALFEPAACRLVVLSMPMLEDVVEQRAADATPAPPSAVERWARAHPDVTWIEPRSAMRHAMQRLLAEIAERRLATEQVWRRNAQAPVPLTQASESVFFLDDPWHLTARGHLVVAHTVDEALERAGLLR